jgi:ribosomal protein S18 acetylase RimI-like enzyme
MKKTDCIYRPATTADIPIVAELSGDWEKENCVRGYCKDDERQLSKFRIYVAEEAGKIIGYLLGTVDFSKNMGAVIPDGSAYFAIEELYIVPAYRSQGVGGMLMKYLENILLSEKIEKIVLSTATKDYKRILHFYIDEMGMSFWNAQLFKDLSKQ